MNDQLSKRSRSARAKALDEKLEQLLDQMLEQNETITFRAVARGLQGLKATSSLTRDAHRRGLIEESKAIQVERRQWLEKAQKTSRASSVAKLAAQEREIERMRELLGLQTAQREEKGEVAKDSGISRDRVQKRQRLE